MNQALAPAIGSSTCAVVSTFAFTGAFGVMIFRSSAIQISHSSGLNDNPVRP